MPEIAIAVQEKPILFSGAMVRKIIEDLKTKTRRVIKEVPHFMHYGRDIMDWSLSGVHQAEEDQPYGYPEKKGSFYLEVQTDVDDNSHREIFCPYGKPGDRLWVKESIRSARHGITVYAEDGCPVWKDGAESVTWPWPKAKVVTQGMPRWASRLTLEIVSVKVERVQDISEEDAIAEGCHAETARCSHGKFQYDEDAPFHNNAREDFSCLWDAINAKREGGKYAWAANPWVWAIEFRRVEPTQ